MNQSLEELARRATVWFNPDSIREAMARSVGTATAMSTSLSELANKKREAERKILEKGIAVCLHCGEEIKYNPDTISTGLSWESENMLSWCDNQKGNHHQPKIVLDEG